MKGEPLIRNLKNLNKKYPMGWAGAFYLASPRVSKLETACNICSVYFWVIHDESKWLIEVYLCCGNGCVDVLEDSKMLWVLCMLFDCSTMGLFSSVWLQYIGFVLECLIAVLWVCSRVFDCSTVLWVCSQVFYCSTMGLFSSVWLQYNGFVLKCLIAVHWVCSRVFDCSTLGLFSSVWLQYYGFVLNFLIAVLGFVLECLIAVLWVCSRVFDCNTMGLFSSVWLQYNGFVLECGEQEELGASGQRHPSRL
jgi:hypothetical protein